MPSRKRATLRLPSWIWKAGAIATLLSINSTGIFRNQAFDGVARATPIKVTPPAIRLSLSATPKRNNSGVIKLWEGQPLTIQLKAINANDPKGKDPDKVNSLSVYTDMSTPLPEGATFESKTSDTGTLTWTPQSGDALRYPGKLLKFGAQNNYTQAMSRPQTVVIKVMDNSSPAFTDGLPSNLTFPVGVLTKLDITTATAPKTGHKARIVLAPESSLPAGARLSANRKGPDGYWHRMLKWKPKSADLGTSGLVSFLATNADVSLVAAETAMDQYDLDYSVVAVP